MMTIIGTKQQAVKQRNALSKEAYELLVQTVAILDDNYGSQRDYTKVGGYCIIADGKESLDITEEMIPEWEEVYADVIVRLYLLGDDFAIVLFMRGETE